MDSQTVVFINTLIQIVLVYMAGFQLERFVNSNYKDGSAANSCLVMLFIFIVILNQ